MPLQKIMPLIGVAFALLFLFIAIVKAEKPIRGNERLLIASQSLMLFAFLIMLLNN